VTAVLVTGFEPFDGSQVNPSQLLVDALDGDVTKALLPVSYARAADALRRAIRDAEPEVVICFGQADGRTGISIERFAHNLDDGATTDNDEAQGSGTAIEPDGPLAYASTLPVDEIVAALRADGIPASASRDAGAFLCNHVFYVLMRALEQERPEARGGFVHVPLLPEQALDRAAASMPLESLVRAARVIVTVCEQHRSVS
jgi:pyroglutamyl-peptidase